MSLGLPRWLSGKESADRAGGHRLGQEDPLEKEMATHSSILGCSPRGHIEADMTE